MKFDHRVYSWFAEQRWRALDWTPASESRPVCFACGATLRELRDSALESLGAAPSAAPTVHSMVFAGLELRPLRGLPPGVIYLVQGERVLAELRCATVPDLQKPSPQESP